MALTLLEAGLRLGGFGYPTDFLLTRRQDGKTAFIQNNQFGRRFFGAQRSRRPHPLYIAQPKPAHTVRIFLFGESAAYGDPYPAFGLPRMLQTILASRYPGVQFQVENAAMTAINSHAILPIARDCAHAGGDIWVIYMGNNEVVGPFGAGTVFSSQTPPIWLIHSTLWLKTTRIGQLADALLSNLRRAPSGTAAWGGMEMFLSQQVPADDPRMKPLYQHFTRNLEDILDAGQNCGVGILLSTVAVNLKDCPPFASQHRRNISEQDKTRWEKLYRLACQAQDAGSNELAGTQFSAAASIDGQFAELTFRQAQCALALGKVSEARADFSAARDLDALRFRCDSTLNELIRRTASARQNQSIRLVDAEQALDAASSNGVPGDEFFYDHVHLTSKGNYILARTIAEQMEPLLPVSVKTNQAHPAPSQSDCERILAWSDFTRLEASSQMLGRFAQPPFTTQAGHQARIQLLRQELARLVQATETHGVTQAIAACNQALTLAPNDPLLYAQLGFLERVTGDPQAVEACAHRQTELLPSDLSGWNLLGATLQQQARLPDAETAFRRAVELDPGDARTLLNLANVVAARGRSKEAESLCRRAVRAEPGFCMGWITLGRMHEQAGERKEAENAFRQALACGTDPGQAATLASFSESRGWLDAAATNYAVGLKVDPTNVKLRRAAGKNLVRMGRYDEAAQQFREALQVQPESAEIHIELGEALMLRGHDEESLREFETALQHDPTNIDAQEYASRLKAKLSSRSQKSASN